MLRKYTNTEIEQASLHGQTIAILGYGSQGRSQALNLRDSGEQIIIGNRPGKSYNTAKQDGFPVMTISQATQKADILAIMLPDETAAEIYTSDIAPNLTPGKTLLFAHGFNIHYTLITPPKDVDVILVAPKGVGPMVRKLYLEGKGVPSLVCAHQNATGHALETALAYARDIGSGRTAIFATTFKDETETDLFGEQTIICGGIPSLIETAYSTLIEAGYPEELAYSECAHEAKLVIDLIYEGGFTKMHDYVSKTASYGGITRGNRLINDSLKKEMQTILREIQDGRFAREWMNEKHNGSANYHTLVENVRTSNIEKTGHEFRKTINGE